MESSLSTLSVLAEVTTGFVAFSAIVAALASMSPPILMFVAAMIGGQWLASRFK